jgi:hypothetical protein
MTGCRHVADDDGLVCPLGSVPFGKRWVLLTESHGRLRLVFIEGFGRRAEGNEEIAT